MNQYEHSLLIRATIRMVIIIMVRSLIRPDLYILYIYIIIIIMYSYIYNYIYCVCDEDNSAMLDECWPLGCWSLACRLPATDVFGVPSCITPCDGAGADRPRLVDTESGVWVGAYLPLSHAKGYRESLIASPRKSLARRIYIYIDR